MPGPTPKANPWADELKKSRRRKSSSSKIAGKSEANTDTSQPGMQPLTLGETKEMDKEKKAGNKTSKLEKAKLDEKAQQPKCVNDKTRPPKVKPPSLPIDEESRSLYQDARSQLRPVARMLSRQMSKDMDKIKEQEEETPVDRLIRQGSLEAATPPGTLGILHLFALFLSNEDFFQQQPKPSNRSNPHEKRNQRAQKASMPAEKRCMKPPMHMQCNKKHPDSL